MLLCTCPPGLFVILLSIPFGQTIFIFTSAAILLYFKQFQEKLQFPPIVQQSLIFAKFISPSSKICHPIIVTKRISLFSTFQQSRKPHSNPHLTPTVFPSTGFFTVQQLSKSHFSHKMSFYPTRQCPKPDFSRRIARKCDPGPSHLLALLIFCLC